MDTKVYLSVNGLYDPGCLQLGKFVSNDGGAEFKPLGDFLWSLRNLKEVQRAENPEGGGGSGGAYGSECIGVHDFKP
ncbi:hypothetical protein J2S89_003394 [Arthrobacter bambusae]|nr:hypothetical protein [Arthrobacter bambusae]MDQ0031539.1 hypothetical protein [Arthrobacter bambusae]MDQ0099762.1 hypothetical protein [Arthrobacter bambusae]